MQVFDKDMSKGVDKNEVDQTLESFAAMGGAFQQPDGGPNAMADMIDAARRLAPSVFALLDADDNKLLDKKELKWFGKAQAAFKDGTLRNLTRDVFDTLDASGDDVLSADELAAAADVDGEVLAAVVAKVHEAFPIRKDADELKKLLLGMVEAAGASRADGIALIDADGDGQIQRKEAGKAFASAKKAFTSAVTTLQQMGPMLAMFGGGGGMGGMPGGMPMGGGRGRGTPF